MCLFKLDHHIQCCCSFQLKFDTLSCHLQIFESISSQFDVFRIGSQLAVELLRAKSMAHYSHNCERQHWYCLSPIRVSKSITLTFGVPEFALLMYGRLPLLVPRRADMELGWRLISSRPFKHQFRRPSSAGWLKQGIAGTRISGNTRAPKEMPPISTPRLI